MEILLLYISGSKNNFWHGVFFQPPNTQVLSFSMMCQTDANFLFLFFPFLQRDNEDEELCSVFVPTNHLYIGDIFLVNSKDILRPNLSIREGIGMSYAFVNLWYRSIVTICLLIDFLVGRGELICLITYNDLHRYVTLHLIYAWLSQGMV